MARSVANISTCPMHIFLAAQVLRQTEFSIILAIKRDLVPVFRHTESATNRCGVAAVRSGVTTLSGGENGLSIRCKLIRLASTREIGAKKLFLSLSFAATVARYS
jgi:hypothetical protein